MKERKKERKDVMKNGKRFLFCLSVGQKRKRRKGRKERKRQERKERRKEEGEKEKKAWKYVVSVRVESPPC